jgi:WXG100 family type VII secretion target
MAEEIFMDVAAVKKMAGQFEQMNDKLQQTSKALQAAITMLKASAFIGMAGNAAYAAYLEKIKPQIDQYAHKCSEMSSDLTQSAEAYQRGDQQGAARFH